MLSILLIERTTAPKSTVSTKVLQIDNEVQSQGRGVAPEAEHWQLMHQPDLARKLALLATEVDSLAKALVQAQEERAREADRRKRADAEAEELRQELRHARRRAKAAERELARLSGSIEATAHRAKTSQRELRARLEDAEQAKQVLHHEVEQIERERHALELNLREVLGNLRHAAQEAQQSRSAPRSGVDEATLVPSREPDNGW